LTSGSWGAAKCEIGFGTDSVAAVGKLPDRVLREYPGSICFATKLIVPGVNMLTRWTPDGASADEDRLKKTSRRHEPTFAETSPGAFRTRIPIMGFLYRGPFSPLDSIPHKRFHGRLVI